MSWYYREEPDKELAGNKPLKGINWPRGAEAGAFKETGT